MKCSLCKKPSVYLSPSYCKSHFIDYFENKAIDTIKRFRLFKKTDKICVAVSGGKDSLSLLYLLNKHKYHVSALAIDEGISGYRDKTLFTLKSFCKSNKVRLNILSFKKHFNKSLDEILKDKSLRPCTVCGVFRRNLLNLGSSKFDTLATGHNLDDEAQAIVMNLVKCNISILDKLGPISGTKRINGFTQRVKPFYLHHEKEIMVYSFINKLNVEFNECPNISDSFRLRIRDLLNEIEMKSPGTKENIIKWFLDYKKKNKIASKKESLCTLCGEPSGQQICNTCKFKADINK
jgi:uncharacterized protein (TIGR00269 family)